MMSEPGHIYVLVNPSMEGLVKIGKTTRDPDARAKEVSQATGVPTPFHVAFSVEVSDCHAAEDYAHTVLETTGCVRFPNREFFEAPLRRVIEVLLQVEREFAMDSQSEFNPESSFSADQNEDVYDDFDDHPGAKITHQAMDTYFGFGDEVENRPEGIRLLKQAIALNYAPAYTCTAEVLIWQSERLGHQNDLHGMRRLREEALEVLREGARKGHGRCYVQMARIFERLNLEENASKCWKKYFRSETFVKDDDQKWGHFAHLRCVEYDVGGMPRASFARLYLSQLFLDGLPNDPEILRLLRPLYSEILSEVRAVMNCFDAERQPKSRESEKRFLAFVESTFATHPQPCPHCGASLAISEADAGQTLECADCLNHVIFQFDPSPVPPPLPPVLPLPPPIQANTSCPACGKLVSLTAAVCPHCGQGKPGIKASCPRCGALMTPTRAGFSGKSGGDKLGVPRWGFWLTTFMFLPTIFLGFKGKDAFTCPRCNRS